MDHPGAVSVNVYNRSTIRARLIPGVLVAHPGNDFDVVLKLESNLPVKFDGLHAKARLVAPAHSATIAYTDLKTIPVRDRKRYLRRDVPEAPFDEVRFLADYERRKPGVFAIRDEEIKLAPQQDGSFRAEVKDNRYPGVYRLSGLVGGTVTMPNGKAEAYSATLSTQVVLRVLPDAQASRPTLHWLAPHRIVVTVTPSDQFGNVVSPANVAAPTLYFDGIPVVAKYNNPLTGTHELHVRVGGHGIELSADGQGLAAGVASIPTAEAECPVLRPNDALKFEVKIFGVRMPVTLPRITCHCDTRHGFSAGTDEARQIPLKKRVPFETAEEAKAAGFTIQTNDAY